MLLTLSAFAAFVPVAWYAPLNLNNSDLVFRFMSFLNFMPGLYSPPGSNVPPLLAVALTVGFRANFLAATCLLLQSATFFFRFCLYASWVQSVGDYGSVL